MMQKMWFLLWVFSFIGSTFLVAQAQNANVIEERTDSTTLVSFSQNNNNLDGYVNIIANTEIEALVQKNRYVNGESPYINGWRVQIIQSTNKTKVLNIRASFASRYPHLPLYYDYVQPYFKLRVGDFQNRYEAYKLYKEINGTYNRAFLVRDKIKLSKL